MTYLPLLLSLFAVDMLAAMSPGPNSVLVIQTAMRSPFRQAFAVVIGILAANLLWCLGVALGLSTLFRLAPWLYTALKILGGAYLIYLGIALWRTKPQAPVSFGTPTPSALFPAFARGLFTNLSNPKSVVYFGSIFTLFMGPTIPFWVKVFAIGIVLFDTVLWYGTVAALFSRVQIQRKYQALERTINRVTGTVMAGFGVRLVLVRD